jgi:hypothetical protein
MVPLWSCATLALRKSTPSMSIFPEGLSRIALCPEFVDLALLFQLTRWSPGSWVRIQSNIFN